MVWRELKKSNNEVESSYLLVLAGGEGAYHRVKAFSHPRSLALAGNIVKSISHKYLINFLNELRGKLFMCRCMDKIHLDYKFMPRLITWRRGRLACKHDTLSIHSHSFPYESKFSRTRFECFLVRFSRIPLARVVARKFLVFRNFVSGIRLVDVVCCARAELKRREPFNQGRRSTRALSLGPLLGN